MFFLFVVSVCELKKLDICNEYRAPGNKVDSEHPGKNLRIRRNIHTLQTTRSSLNTNHTKNTNSTQTVNIGQNTCTQIPKLRPRSPKNYSAHSEGTVCLSFGLTMQTLTVNLLIAFLNSYFYFIINTCIYISF